jgi:hypothetical protein
MFSFLSSLTEARDRWLHTPNTIPNTAPYLNPDLNTKLISISNTNQVLITDLKIEPISNTK